jgi:hypothetical protein
MHGKCRIVRFKIIVFQVMGLCILTGGHQGFGQDLVPPYSRLPVKTDPGCFSKTLITMYQTTWCPNPDSIINCHHWEHLKSFTKEYKEQLKRRWKCHVGKTVLQEAQYMFKDTIFNTILFSQQLCTLFSYFGSQTNSGNAIWNTSWLQTLPV